MRRPRISPESVAWLVAGLALATIPDCGPAREALMGATTGVPSPTPGVDAGTNRCNGSVPEVCSSTGRCWPALPRDAFGRQRVCVAGCTLDDAIENIDIGGPAMVRSWTMASWPSGSAAVYLVPVYAAAAASKLAGTKWTRPRPMRA